MMARLKEPHHLMSWMQRLEPCNKYAYGHLNTNRVWMGRRECAGQQQGDKKSIPMDAPTRQCLRKRKRDKTEPSFQEHRVSVQKQRNGSIAEDTKQRLDCSLVPLHKDAATNNSLSLLQTFRCY